VSILTEDLRFLKPQTQEMFKNSTSVRKIITIFATTNFFSFYSIRSVFRQPEFIKPAPIPYKEKQQMLLEDYRTW
jgi:hypothetical protein